MTENMQEVEGGGILDALAKLLFGGLEKALDYAAEYEEDMGVLKQVTRIPLIPDDGSNRRYILKVSLAPVKDRENWYYVEAETDAPNFDVSSINEKAIKLDKSNTKDFKRMIDQLIEKNNLEKVPPEETEEEISEEAEEAQDKEFTITKQQANQIASNIKAARDYIKGRRWDLIFENYSPDVNVELKVDDDPAICNMYFSATDNEGKEIAEFNGQDNIYTVDDDGEPFSEDEFIDRVEAAIVDYEDTMVREHNMEQVKLSEDINRIGATFVKASNEVQLTAITASRDIIAAMDVITSIMEDDEFANSLSEEPQSFEIAEVDDGYEVNEIEYVDVSGTYDAIFKTLNEASLLLSTYHWAIGDAEWFKDSLLDSSYYTLSGMCDNAARWVIQHTDHYPIPTCEALCDPSLSDIMTDGKPDINRIHEAVVHLFETIAEFLDSYYVNLEHNEQAKVDDFINSVETMLVYA